MANGNSSPRAAVIGSGFGGLAAAVVLFGLVRSLTAT